MAERIDIFVVLKQLSEFLQQTKQASKGVEQIGTATEQTGKKASVSWKSIAKWAGAATAAYGAARFVKGAVTATEDLGRASLALHRTTGLDISTSSQWISVARERGISAQQLQMGFVKLSRTMDSAATGSKTATKTWQRLGISMREVKSGDTSQVMLDTADALRRIRNPAERASLVMTLFGRAGQRLMPVLAGGSQGIREQLAVVRRYGDYLGVKTVGQLRTLLGRQREMGTAFDGLKIQLGTALLPVLLSVAKVLIDFTRLMAPLTSNATLMRITIVVLTAAFVAYKIAMIAATIANAGFNAELLITLGWIALVIAALVLIGVGVYELVKHWGAVKKAADYVWNAIKAGAADVLNWLRRYWPLIVGVITGPIGFAVVMLVTHWKAIKQAASDVVNWVKAKFSELIGFFQSLPGRIGNWLKKVPGVGTAEKLLGAGGHAVGWVGKHLQAGGTLASRSFAMVGEAGPEIVSLPAGATVAPLSRGETLAGAGAFGGTIELRVPVYLDRRQIAEAVGTYTADKLARR